MNITAAEYGRQNAPDHIKDKESWGRRMMRSLRRQQTQAVVHLEALQNCDSTRSYKCPHAPVGTATRPHFSRYTRTPRLCNH